MGSLRLERSGTQHAFERPIRLPWAWKPGGYRARPINAEPAGPARWKPGRECVIKLALSEDLFGPATYFSIVGRVKCSWVFVRLGALWF